MGEVQPRAWAELQGHLGTLEGHHLDMCDVEFTVEQGKLWLLQTRVGKRTAVAEWIMAHDMLAEGLIDMDTALLRLDANRLEELFKKVIAEGVGVTPIAVGLNASPGAAVGKAVFSADDAQAWATRGEPVILVRRETTPDDYHGMIRSEGILTSAGGPTATPRWWPGGRASRRCVGPTRSGSTARPAGSAWRGRRWPRGSG
jgi:pyruvate, orthophosphate dikinase